MTIEILLWVRDDLDDGTEIPVVLNLIFKNLLLETRFQKNITIILFLLFLE